MNSPIPTAARSSATNAIASTRGIAGLGKPNEENAASVTMPTGSEPSTPSAASAPQSTITSGSGNAIQSQTIDRSESGLPQIAGSGYHMPPEVLGRESPTQQEPTQQPRRSTSLANVNSKAKKRCKKAIKATKSQAAAAAAAQAAALSDQTVERIGIGTSSMFTCFNYRGMEVIFACTAPNRVAGVCSRTHFLFQTLDLPSDTPVVSISSNPHSGMIVVAHLNGVIQTYTPITNNVCDAQKRKRTVGTTDENTDSDAATDPTRRGWGRFRWIDGRKIVAAQIFYQPDEVVEFRDRRNSKAGELVDISSSTDQKLLVAHRNQLAVFDALTPDLKQTKEDAKDPVIGQQNATLLWTSILSSNIVTAKMSGDGQALAVVTEQPIVDGCYGATTFIHDMDDGSNPVSRPNLERSASIGMVFKPGPSLNHEAPVTRISFRGMGHVTSSMGEEDGQGNDLLLTYCDDDSSVRIFNQNNWQQLMFWVAPPNSRADWIRGASAFTLGDLESQKKPKTHGSKPPSRRPSVGSTTDSSAGGGINGNLRSIRSLGAGTPTTAAGAWIAEITFRDAFPALRLSRLSYMKRGNDDSQPAHFESVAAILPAGSIAATTVLDADDMGLAIQGIWPAWNPWLSESTGVENSDTLRGSAMQFLGLSSLPPSTGAFFGESYLGGTHSPPIELRITASHPTPGCIMLMEFPLWGDEDFGAMELGSPVRSVLSVSDALSTPTIDIKRPENSGAILGISMEYKSSRLCANLETDGKLISLLWRRPGSMSLHTLDDSLGGPDGSRSILDSTEPFDPEVWNDLSVIPVPLALPPLRLPVRRANGDEDTISHIRWWPDSSYGGPPLLVAFTGTGTILIFEIPPPWCVREPVMPNHDPFNTVSSAESMEDMQDSFAPESISDECDDIDSGRVEYDVVVTPHPDFGLGLRLESPMDGMPAVAGSFKKHPLNGGMLPAEKTGMIILGDEVLSVNGVLLEDLTFDDIIATVRHVGAEAGPGEPLTLRFRPASTSRNRRNSAVLHESLNSRGHSDNVISEPEVGSGRRSVMGVSPQSMKRNQGYPRKASDGSSWASLLVGNPAEAQQEFGRLIAIFQDSLPCKTKHDLTNRLLVLPWGPGIGAPDPNELRAAALVVVGVGNAVIFKRLELAAGVDPDKSRSLDLGELKFSDSVSQSPEICNIVPVDNPGPRRCFAVSDNLGLVRLVFVDILDEPDGCPPEGGVMKRLCQVRASYFHYEIFRLGSDAKNYRIHAASPCLFASVAREVKPNQTIHIWSARPDSTCRVLETEGALKDDSFGMDYYETVIDVESSDLGCDILDLRFLTTGFIDASPSLVAFLNSGAVVYQQRNSKTKWIPLLRLRYSSIPGSSFPNPSKLSLQRLESGLSNSPADVYPHLGRSISAILPSHDETKTLISDWHPESLLCLLCSDNRGPNVSLTAHVEKILLWLIDTSENMDSNRAESRSHGNSPLCVVPFESMGGKSYLQNGTTDTARSEGESLVPQFLAKGSQRRIHDNDWTDNMLKLTGAIDGLLGSGNKSEVKGRSHELQVAMSPCRESELQESGLRSMLKALNMRELHVLKAVVALVASPPDYRNLDVAGQLALTMNKIHVALRDSLEADSSNSALKRSNSLVNPSSFSVLTKRLPSGLSDARRKLPPHNASAGSMAALFSDYQGVLLDCIRRSGEKFDWPTVREARVPFWVRSDEKLRQISEEIGQNLYRKSRDILKSAIFFLIAGKKRTLTNLSAADRTESGKKFYKFLTSFDFSSDRGRSAAEKNAFSLLRKNQYDSAAAFFLLSEPPGLKSAVETIASKMEDLDLAFLVARLVGDGGTGTDPLTSMNKNVLGFGGMLGGGGGYAGAGIDKSSETAKDVDGFLQWKPRLQKGAIQLLRDRGLPASRDDPCFSALQMLWLGKNDEASHWLSGFVGSPNGLIPRFLDEVRLPVLSNISSGSKTLVDSTIPQTNSFLNFVLGPFLLKAMSASSRTRMASSLLVSESLSKRGIELPAIQLLLQHLDSLDPNATKDDAACEQKKNADISTLDGSKRDVVSSIFDDYISTAPAKKKQSDSTGSSNGSPGTGLSSSIFDSFDVPIAKKQLQESVPSSSIFDSFDVAPIASKPNSRKEKQKAPSVFDSFDVPTPVKMPAKQGVGSSIFDSFDGPIAKEQLQESVPSSSIFDSFDVAPIASKPNSGKEKEKAPSIFDSFDVPTPVKMPTKHGVESSIFDSFDGPVVSSNTEKSIAVHGEKSSFDAPVEPVDSTKSRHAIPDISPGPIRAPPKIWVEWRGHVLLWSAARRLIRELASVCVRFQGHFFEPPLTAGGVDVGRLIPKDASHVLQFHCDGDSLIQEVESCVRNISRVCTFEEQILVKQALLLLWSPDHYQRVSLAVLLRLSLKEFDEAEDLVRNTSQLLIDMCSTVSFSNHRVSCGNSCIARASNCCVNKSASSLCWQLEVCLWMHRGGALPLSGDVLSEAVCAVRVGLLVASWNQNFECIETMIQQPPDCLMNHSVGRQLWTSLKVISSSAVGEKKYHGTSSGGWEFLVDCRRAEATVLLRPRPTGCFIIRPHPDDHGVFTLSFKTNLVPAMISQPDNGRGEKPISASNTVPKSNQKTAKPVKRDDVVQHAIIRLSDSGFRCGSFGPFATLMKLLEAVSSSLPFDLRFDQPPTEGVIKEEGSKPSPNAAFLRKFSAGKGENTAPHYLFDQRPMVDINISTVPERSGSQTIAEEQAVEKERADAEQREKFSHFLELLVLSEVRKQLCGVAAAKYDSVCTNSGDDEVDSVGSISDRSTEMSAEQEFTVPARVLRPLLTWCQMMEIGIVSDLAPRLEEVSPGVAFFPVALNASETAIEISTTEASSGMDGGDAVVRRMIQPGSGVEFRTLRLGDAGESAMVVLFSKKEAIEWFLDNSVEKTEREALRRLDMMEKSRVVEPIDQVVLAPKAYRKTVKGEDDEDPPADGEAAGKTIRYRLVDPWEVEPLESREAETRGASLGRHRFLAFSLGTVATVCEDMLSSIGGRHLLELWVRARGGVALTKAIATVHAPWERDSGGDLQLHGGVVSEPAPYINSIRQHLYRNALFRRLRLPQRFMALIQVELLDLKNLTSPGGSLSLTVYSLLRLKRSRSSAPLTVKARTLDSVATTPMKLGKSTGPNAPASWGTLVRFRFPLPEYTAADGKSYDGDREALFKGPPSVLQVSVYEKKFMSDAYLGGADVKLDGLVSGGQLEEWVPLRTETHGINWFARMRLTLRFELMCLSSDAEHGGEGPDNLAPSVGLRRIRQLSSIGGAQEDLKKSASTPDLLSYFESMVY